MKYAHLFLTALSFVYADPALELVLRCQASIGAVVDTTDGPIRGAASDLRAEVSTYLGIPFAQAPIGNLRFAPPVAAQAHQETFNATSFSPDCLCNLVPTDKAYLAGEAGAKFFNDFAQTGHTFSEDCLTLNVWTKPQTGEDKKAVLFWIYGGGFSTGNTDNPIYDGSVLADENDVVVVSASYRTNIFGFSGAPGLAQNVGLLDQRLALEWVRDNVAAFGGDPDRITVFGQSAGGNSADYLAYAYPDDPIAHAFIPQSGVAGGTIVPERNETTALQAWYNVSSSLGCGGSESGEATVDCVRSKDGKTVLKAIEPLQTTALLSGFSPTIDGKVIFSNYSMLGEQGAFAKVPILVGNTDNESPFFFALFALYTNITAAELATASHLITLGQPIADLITALGWSCQTARTFNNRVSNGVPAWRYVYYGGTHLGDSGGGCNNTKIKYVGSDYHLADLPIVFGTSSSSSNIPDSRIEAQAASYQRRIWTEFAKDPVGGLESQFGWVPGNNSVYRLSYLDEVEASRALPSDTDALCPLFSQNAALTAAVSGVLAEVAEVALGSDGASLYYVLKEQAAQLVDLLEPAAIQDPTGKVNETIAGLEAFLSALGNSTTGR